MWRILNSIYVTKRETVFSQITQRFPKSIHAVTMDGFLMKIVTFIMVHTLESALIV